MLAWACFGQTASQSNESTTRDRAKTVWQPCAPVAQPDRERRLKNSIRRVKWLVSLIGASHTDIPFPLADATNRGLPPRVPTSRYPVEF